MPKKKKAAARRATKAPRLTAREERELLLQTLLEAGEYELASDVAYVSVRETRTRRAKVRTKALTTTLKRKPTKAEEKLSRARHERAQRAAATRKQPHQRITSKSARVTRARVKYKEIGFEFGDILSGRNPSNPEVRAQFDREFSAYIGKDVQVSFGISIRSHGMKVGSTRVRRIARNFQGRDDIARLSSSAVREAMRQLGSEGGAYITSVSVQELR